MTAEPRVKAVAEFGFTERQARFLATVMLHSGVCLQRQYARFAGIVHGQKTRKFFDRLVRRGHVRAYTCRHNRGRVYRVHHKPLYRAIGETDSRHRRPMSAVRVVDNLVLLDAMLATPSVEWLTGDKERPVHLARVTGISPEEAERLTRREGDDNAARATRDRMPIGVDPSGRWVFVYVVTGDQRDDFEWFLQRHAGTLAVLPAWTLRIAVPPDLAWLGERYREEARCELATALPDLVNHLRWYFRQRRAHTLERALIDNQEGYDEAHYAFGATRLQVLYRRWLKQGDTAFEAISSAAIAEAIKHGVGRVECLVLPFSYLHLSPLVGSTRSTSQGAEEGEDRPTPSRPPLGSSSFSSQVTPEHATQTSA
ncbi:MAG: hypothetical protein DMG02_08420 [Acidobacteria bacterium]|nr:MAG: hypothetical protein DMG02_08420 [Acidobacteriota bacterium]